MLQAMAWFQKCTIRQTNHSVGGLCALIGSRDVMGRARIFSLTSMLCEETSTESSPEERKAGMRPLHEEYVPGVSLNARTPSSLKILQLKQWLLCRNASTRGQNADLVLRYHRRRKIILSMRAKKIA